MKKGHSVFHVSLTMPDSWALIKFSNAQVNNPCNVWRVCVDQYTMNSSHDEEHNRRCQRQKHSAIQKICRNMTSTTGSKLIELSTERRDLSFLSAPAIVDLITKHCAGDEPLYDHIDLTNIGLTSMAGCPAKLSVLDLSNNSIEVVDAAPIIAKNVILSNNPIASFDNGVVIEAVEQLDLNWTQIDSFYKVTNHVKAITVGLAINRLHRLSEAEFELLDSCGIGRAHLGDICQITIAPTGGILGLLDVLNAGRSKNGAPGAFLRFGRPSVLGNEIGQTLQLRGDLGRGAGVGDGALYSRIESMIENGARDIHLLGENRRKVYMSVHRKLHQLNVEHFI